MKILILLLLCSCAPPGLTREMRAHAALASPTTNDIPSFWIGDPTTRN